MKKKLRDGCQMLVVAAALVLPGIGSADDNNAGRDHSNREDRDHENKSGRDNDDDKDLSFRKLSAQWWQWILSIPTIDSPLLDQSGEKCMVGQRGPIWFLAGLPDPRSAAVSRTCSVPQGTTLFFPVANYAQVNTPGDCGQNEPLAVAEMRSNLAPLIDSINIRTVTVDGVAVGGITRVRSVPFVTALPKDNLFVAPCTNQSPAGQRPGIFSPSVGDGYYVKIDGLKAGKHLLQFTAKSNAGTFDHTVTYDLTVVPVSLR